MVGEYAAPVGEKRLGAPYVCMVIASVNVIQKGEGRFLTVQRGRLTVVEKHDSLKQPSPLTDVETTVSGGTEGYVYVKATNWGPLNRSPGPLFNAGYAAGVADTRAKYARLVEAADAAIAWMKPRLAVGTRTGGGPVQAYKRAKEADRG